ncbi:terpene synthase family protein [Streptomyces olivoreticuli]
MPQEFRVLTASDRSASTTAGGQIPEISYTHLSALVSWAVHRLGELHPNAPTDEASRIEGTDEAVMDRVKQFGFTEPNLLRVLDERRINTLVRLNLATAPSPGVLHVTNMYYVWAGLLDDCVSEAGLPMNPYVKACGEALRTGTLPEHAPDGQHCVCKYIHDTVVDLGGETIIGQLANDTDAAMAAWVQEQQQRSVGGTMSLTEYLGMRERGVTYTACAFFLRLGMGLTGPDRRSPNVRKLERLMSTLIGIENDAWSCHTELRCGIVPSLIKILTQNYRIPVELTFPCMVSIAATLKAQQDELIEQICADPNEPPEYVRYARAVANWPDQHYAWAYVTPWYRIQQFAAAHDSTAAFPADLAQQSEETVRGNSSAAVRRVD